MPTAPSSSSQLKVTPTQLPDVLLLEPRVFRDDRGFFLESYNEATLAGLGIHPPLRSGQPLLLSAKRIPRIALPDLPRAGKIGESGQRRNLRRSRGPAAQLAQFWKMVR